MKFSLFSTTITLPQNLQKAGPILQEQPFQSPSLTRFRDERFWILPTFLYILALSAAVVMAIIQPYPWNNREESSNLRPEQLISAVGQLSSLLFAIIGCIWVARRSQQPRSRWGWSIIALALFTFLLGYFLPIILPGFGITLDSGQTVAVNLPFYPIMAIGITLLPIAPREGNAPVRALTDAGIIVLTFLLLVFVFLIVNWYKEPNHAGQLLFIAYPIADLFLVIAVVLFGTRGVEKPYRPILFWLAIGMTCFVTADTLFNVASYRLPQQFTGGFFYIDPFWIAGSFSFGISAFYLLIQGTEPGKTWEWLVHLKTQPTPRPLQLAIWQILLTSLPVPLLFVLVLNNAVPKDDIILYSLFITILIGILVLVLIRQILAVRELVAAQIVLAQAQQLDEIKDQFITNINHELRTPIMTMQGYIELLNQLDTSLEAPKRADMLSRAQRANVTLVSLLQSILDTRRVDQEANIFTPNLIYLNSTVNKAIELLDPREGLITGHTIKPTIPSDIMVWGDAVWLQQIITNLVSNAIKYSPTDTEITIQARSLMIAPSRFSLRRQRNTLTGPIIEIRIHDNGLGIPAEQIPLLFRRFVRLPRDLASKVRGTGLGLYLCRVFTEAMGGKIWVESSGVPGEGSTFYLQLPQPPQTMLTTDETMPRKAVGSLH